MRQHLKRKYSLIAAAAALVIGGTMVSPIAAQAAKPSILIWVDAPRLPGAQLYAKIMAPTVNVKVELHAQGDLLAKVQLFNRIKKGWEVIFDCEITEEQVGLAMAWVKIARESYKHKRDNLTDGAGYLGTIEMVIKERELRANKNN